MADMANPQKNTPGFVILGVVIAILGVLTVISSTYSQYQNDRQDRVVEADRECMKNQIQDIVKALKIRAGSSSQRDDELQKLVNKLAESPMMTQDPSAYNIEQNKFENKKDQNSYPNGVCK